MRLEKLFMKLSSNYLLIIKAIYIKTKKDKQILILKVFNQTRLKSIGNFTRSSLITKQSKLIIKCS